jgi:Leucine-rich repeat (LRR) protein
MGNGPSLEEGKFKGSSTDLTIFGTKIKSKEVAKHVKKLDTDFPNLSMLFTYQTVTSSLAVFHYIRKCGTLHIHSLYPFSYRSGELHVRQCRLKVIPNNICELTALTVLDLDDNKISLTRTPFSPRILSLSYFQFPQFPLLSLLHLHSFYYLNLFSVFPFFTLPPLYHLTYRT